MWCVRTQVLDQVEHTRQPRGQTGITYFYLEFSEMLRSNLRRMLSRTCEVTFSQS